MKASLTRRRALKQFALFVAGSPLLRAQYIPRAAHERIPSLDEITSIFEFEPVARAKITQDAYDYVAGGVESEYTLWRNRKAFEWVSLIPRAMADVSTIDTSIEIFGQRMPYPILVAPTAAHQRLHSEGELETHRGATAADVTMLVSNNASYPIGQIAEAAEGPLWQQLYIHRDREGARTRVDQGIEAGCHAVCLTVDAQYSSLRERLLHDRNLSGARSRRRSRSRRRRRRRGSGLSREPTAYRTRPESPDETWKFREALRTWTDLPVLAKGLLTAEDAELAVQNGFDGIVVSNHGARYLAYTPSTIEVLPEIVDTVAGRIPVLIDGGFRRGSDILKALAIGARAVLVGRPPLWGLGAFEAAGTQRALEILEAELVLAMANTGCTRIDDVDRSLVKMDFP